MKTKWIASLILASALTAPAFAGVGVYIGVAPPPLRYEVRPANSWSGLLRGSMDIGTGQGEGMSGSPECGAGHRTQVLIGPILTTTTTHRVGLTTRATGTMKTTATTTTGDIAKMLP